MGLDQNLIQHIRISDPELMTIINSLMERYDIPMGRQDIPTNVVMESIYFRKNYILHNYLINTFAYEHVDWLPLRLTKKDIERAYEDFDAVRTSAHLIQPDENTMVDVELAKQKLEQGSFRYAGYTHTYDATYYKQINDVCIALRTLLMRGTPHDTIIYEADW